MDPDNMTQPDDQSDFEKDTEIRKAENKSEFEEKKQEAAERPEKPVAGESDKPVSGADTKGAEVAKPVPTEAAEKPEAKQADSDATRMQAEHDAAIERMRIDQDAKRKEAEREKVQTDHPARTCWPEERDGRTMMHYSLWDGTIQTREAVEEELSDLGEDDSPIAQRRRAELKNTLTQMDYIDSVSKEREDQAHKMEPSPTDQSAEWLADPAEQQEAQNNYRKFGFRKCRVNGNIYYVLSDGSAVSEKDVQNMEPDDPRMAEIAEIDADPQYASMLDPEKNYRYYAKMAGKIGYTLADAFILSPLSDKNLPNNVKNTFASFRTGLHALLNGDMLGSVGGMINTSLNLMTILGDGVDNYKNHIKQIYGISGPDIALEMGRTMKDRLVTKETRRTQVAIGQALERLAREGARAYGVRAALDNDWLTVDSLKSDGLTDEGAEAIKNAFRHIYYGQTKSDQTPFTEQNQKDIIYMLRYGDYGYDPYLMERFILALNEPTPSVGADAFTPYPAVRPYGQAQLDNKTYDFASALGDLANLARPPLTDQMAEFESTGRYYKGLMRASEEIGRQLVNSDRGYEYVYDPADIDHTTPLVGADGQPKTHKVEPLSSAERRILMAQKAVYDQALQGVDAATGNVYSSSRMDAAGRTKREQTLDNMLKRARIERYTSEPTGGAYQVLAGRQEGEPSYVDGVGDLLIPQEGYDRHGNSVYAKLDENWRRMGAESELASDLLKTNQTYASLHNAWACMDAYRQYSHLCELVDRVNPDSADALKEQLMDYLTQVCEQNRWQGGDLTASDYTRLDSIQWIRDNLGIEPPEGENEDLELNHMFTGCGVKGRLGVADDGAPIYPDVPGSQYNLMIDVDSTDRFDGLAGRFIDLYNKERSGVGMSDGEKQELKRLKVFRAYQYRHRVIDQMKSLADYDDVRAQLGSVEAQQEFRHEVALLLGGNPGKGWEWRDGQITEDHDAPAPDEASFKSGKINGYGFWDLHTKAGRVAALEWLKNMKDAEGNTIGIDIEEFKKRAKASKGLNPYMEPSGAARGRAPIGLKIEPIEPDITKLINQRKAGNFPLLAKDAQEVEASIAKGELNLQRMQYAVEHTSLAPFQFGDDDTLFSLATGLKGEIAALHKLGYISNTSKWEQQARGLLLDAVFAPKDGANYYDTVCSRIDSVGGNISDEGARCQEFIKESVNEFKLAAQEGGKTLTDQDIAREVVSQCKDHATRLILGLVRPKMPNTKRTHTRAQKAELDSLWPGVNACLQDEDIKQYLSDRGWNLEVDPVTKMIRKTVDKDAVQKVKTRKVADLVKAIRESAAVWKNEFDETDPEADHKREFIRKLNTLADVLEVTERYCGNPAGNNIQLPGDWALSENGAQSKAEQFAAELYTARLAKGDEFGVMDGEEYNTFWHNIGSKYGMVATGNQANEGKKADRLDKMKAQGGAGILTGGYGDPQPIMDKAGELGDLGQYIPLLMENVSPSAWTRDELYVGDDMNVDPGREFVSGYRKGGKYAELMDRLGLSPLYTPVLDADGNPTGEGVKADKTGLAPEKDIDKVRTNLTNNQRLTNDGFVLDLQHTIYATAVDVLGKNHDLKYITENFKLGRSQKEGTVKKNFWNAWAKSATDQDRKDLLDNIKLDGLDRLSFSGWDSIRNTAGSPDVVQALGKEGAEALTTRLWKESGLAGRVWVRDGDKYRPMTEADGVPAKGGDYLEVSPYSVLNSLMAGAQHQNLAYPNLRLAAQQNHDAMTQESEDSGGDRVAQILGIKAESAKCNDVALKDVLPGNKDQWNQIAYNVSQKWKYPPNADAKRYWAGMWNDTILANKGSNNSRHMLESKIKKLAELGPEELKAFVGDVYSGVITQDQYKRLCENRGTALKAVARAIGIAMLPSKKAEMGDLREELVDLIDGIADNIIQGLPDDDASSEETETNVIHDPTEEDYAKLRADPDLGINEGDLSKPEDIEKSVQAVLKLATDRDFLDRKFAEMYPEVADQEVPPEAKLGYLADDIHHAMFGGSPGKDWRSAYKKAYRQKMKELKRESEISKEMEEPDRRGDYQIMQDILKTQVGTKKDPVNLDKKWKADVAGFLVGKLKDAFMYGSGLANPEAHAKGGDMSGKSAYYYKMDQGSKNTVVNSRSNFKAYMQAYIWKALTRNPKVLKATLDGAGKLHMWVGSKENPHEISGKEYVSALEGQFPGDKDRVEKIIKNFDGYIDGMYKVALTSLRNAKLKQFAYDFSGKKNMAGKTIVPFASWHQYDYMYGKDGYLETLGVDRDTINKMEEVAREYWDGADKEAEKREGEQKNVDKHRADLLMSYDPFKYGSEGGEQGFKGNDADKDTFIGRMQNKRNKVLLQYDAVEAELEKDKPNLDRVYSVFWDSLMEAVSDRNDSGFAQLISNAGRNGYTKEAIGEKISQSAKALFLRMMRQRLSPDKMAKAAKALENVTVLKPEKTETGEKEVSIESQLHPADVFDYALEEYNKNLPDKKKRTLKGKEKTAYEKVRNMNLARVVRPRSFDDLFQDVAGDTYYNYISKHKDALKKRFLDAKEAPAEETAQTQTAETPVTETPAEEAKPAEETQNRLYDQICEIVKKSDKKGSKKVQVLVGALRGKTDQEILALPAYETLKGMGLVPEEAVPAPAEEPKKEPKKEAKKEPKKRAKKDEGEEEEEEEEEESLKKRAEDILNQVKEGDVNDIRNLCDYEGWGLNQKAMLMDIKRKGLGTEEKEIEEIMKMLNKEGLYKSASKVIRPKSSITKSSVKVIRPKLR